MRTTTIWAPLLAATLAVSACGQGGAPLEIDGGDLLAQVAAATEDAATARMRMEMTADLPGQSGTMRIAMEGVGRLTAAAGAFTYEIEAPAFGGTDLSGAGDMRVIDDATAYVTGPMTLTFGDTSEDAERPWVRIEDAAFSPAMLFQIGTSTAPQGPGDLLQWLRDLTGDVEEVGTERIRETPTTHYRTSTTAARFLDALLAGASEDRDERNASPDPEDLAAAVQAAYEQMEYAFEVWVDGDALLRRSTITMDMAPLYRLMDDEFDGTARSTITFELWDYGVPVEVQPPPASQVRELDTTGFSSGAEEVATESFTEYVAARPSSAQDLPVGLADDLGVPPGARLVTSQVEDGLVAATWTVGGAGVTDLATAMARTLETQGWTVERTGDDRETSLGIEQGADRGLIVLTPTGSNVTIQLTLLTGEG